MFAVFVPNKDFKDETLSLVKLLLNKWDVEYKTIGYSKAAIGMHGALCRIDMQPSEVTSDYRGIIFIDGKGIDESKVYDYRPLLETIIRLNDAKRPIMAVGNAVKIPARANIIKGKKLVVCDQDSKSMVSLFYGTPSNNSIEISGNIITAKDSRAVEDNAEIILQNLGIM